MSEFADLSIAGRVATPADSHWDQARQAWNLAADQRPSAVAFVEGPDDVAAVIGFARERGLGVTAQGTGHGAVALGPLEGVILIKTERMRGVEVDGDARTARVEAGARSSELAEAAQAKGLCYLGGSSPDVGVIGYSLGGGLGWLGRPYGFACNRARGIEVVTVDGEARTVDADNDPDLFWALRGGGGGYAIVTALDVALLPHADVYAGTMLLPAELGADAVRAYRDWAARAPDEVTSIIRFLTPPPIPDVPEPLRGKRLLTIGVASIGNQAEGEERIGPLREIGEPIIDTIAQIPTAALSRIHMDPEQPAPGLGDHAVIAALPDEAIEAFVDTVGPDSGSPLVVAELRQLGGALGRPADGGGALAKLDGAFLMSGIGISATPELAEAIDRHLDRLHDAMEPWRGAGGHLHFPQRPGGVEAILPEEVCERLGEVKRRWDPDGLIRANHNLAPAPA